MEDQKMRILKVLARARLKRGLYYIRHIHLALAFAREADRCLHEAETLDELAGGAHSATIVKLRSLVALCLPPQGAK
jgi:hypothetical protein